MLETQFDQAMQLLGDAFEKKVYNQTSFERKMKLWYEKFGKIPDAEFTAAVNYVIENSERYPTLSQMWGAIYKLRGVDMQKTTASSHLEEIKSEYLLHPPNEDFIAQAIEVCGMAGKVNSESYCAMMNALGWTEGVDSLRQRRHWMLEAKDEYHRRTGRSDLARGGKVVDRHKDAIGKAIEKVFDGEEVLK